MTEPSSLPTGGRELDREVAEKVMGDIGWDFVIDGCSRHGRYFATIAEAEAQMERDAKRFRVGPVVLHGDVPDYSTSIADAFLVVERMREMGYSLVVMPYYNESWACFVKDYSGSVMGQYQWVGSQGDFVIADTAPLAICRKAIEIVAALATRAAAVPPPGATP